MKVVQNLHLLYYLVSFLGLEEVAKPTLSEIKCVRLSRVCFFFKLIDKKNRFSFANSDNFRSFLILFSYKVPFITTCDIVQHGLQTADALLRDVGDTRLALLRSWARWSTHETTNFTDTSPLGRDRPRCHLTVNSSVIGTNDEQSIVNRTYDNGTCSWEK